MTVDPDLQHWRFTVDEYERMVEVGILDADARVELLDGEIVEMSPIKPPHASTVDRMTQLLVLRLTGLAIVRVQNPLRLQPRSEPEPDLVVLEPRADFYASAHPTAIDTLFLVEVSDSSLRLDLRVKMPIYAGQGIAEAWVVDIAGERVLVHTNPDDGSYRHVRPVRRGESITPLALPEVSFGVDEILGA
ncbi:MAG: Uma2 family endonuclease [Pseudonocardia sp.]